ncbi:MAG: 16S rRNA (adenine(1518)-N(6)/adenine(1519)-N(6))-dimethyltransferase RsmA [Patescibacteria group bacterium]
MPEKLGQNFLVDQSIVKKIIESANLEKDDFVLEVGPGKGILTVELAERAGQVMAIEIDTTLIPALKNKFKNQKNVEVVNEDILKISLPSLLGSCLKYKVIANIPYYITSKIIRLFLENNFPPEEMILMVQKEVAERIVACPGKMSLLGLSVQYYATAKILFEVPRKCFSPIPEVDSAVIRITHRMEHGTEEKTRKLFRLARIGFSSKRKTLLNNLANGLHLNKELVLEKLKSAGFSEKTRAQELSLADWKNLTEFF